MPKRLDYTWLSYAGPARIVLAVVLVAAAAVIVYAGTRLRRAVLPPKPSPPVKVIIVVGLTIAVVAFLVCVSVYADGLRRHNLLRILPENPSPITPVTTPGSYAFNVVSKVIAFVTALTLFIPAPEPSTASEPDALEPAVG